MIQLLRIIEAPNIAPNIALEMSAKDGIHQWVVLITAVTYQLNSQYTPRFATAPPLGVAPPDRFVDIDSICT